MGSWSLPVPSLGSAPPRHCQALPHARDSQHQTAPLQSPTATTAKQHPKCQLGHVLISGNLAKGSVPLPFCFVWACEFVKKLAIHFHQGFQHVVHQCHNGSETEGAQPLDLLSDKINFRRQALDFFFGFWASYSRYYCKVREFLKQNPFHFINLQRKL